MVYFYHICNSKKLQLAFIEYNFLKSVVGAKANIVVQPGATFAYDVQPGPSVAIRITVHGNIVSL